MIRNDIFTLLIWIEGILKKEGVDQLLKEFQKSKNEEVKKSNTFPEKTINEQKKTINSMQLKILQMESELLQQ